MANKSYNSFKNDTLGQKIDLDGFPAQQMYQCWDLANKWFKYVGGKIIHCGQTGYVKDIANQRQTNGILDFCDDIGLKATLQPGDICIWTNCAACPSSHIAIYDHDDGQDAVYFLGQNQPYAYVTVTKIPVQGIIGVFRPKMLAKADPTPAPAPTPAPKPVEKKPDQILTVGSKVQSYGFYIQKLNHIKQWGYNSWVGGWFPLKDVDEVDARDGKKDQWVHIGSGVAFRGTLTVSKVNVKQDTVFLKELGYWVKARCLREVKDGK